jgi:hypothetical protein
VAGTACPVLIGAQREARIASELAPPLSPPLKLRRSRKEDDTRSVAVSFFYLWGLMCNRKVILLTVGVSEDHFSIRRSSSIKLTVVIIMSCLQTGHASGLYPNLSKLICFQFFSSAYWYQLNLNLKQVRASTTDVSQRPYENLLLHSLLRQQSS